MFKKKDKIKTKYQDLVKQQLIPGGHKGYASNHINPIISKDQSFTIDFGYYGKEGIYKPGEEYCPGSGGYIGGGYLPGGFIGGDLLPGATQDEEKAKLEMENAELRRQIENNERRIKELEGKIEALEQVIVI